MSSLTTYPRQDQWESTLTADINAADVTIPVSLPPSFSMTTGGANSFYVVIDYDVTAKFEIAECDGISGSNIIVKTGGRGKPKYEGGASTATSHAAGAKIMITDTWKNYADAATAIASKLDASGGTITGSLTITDTLNIQNDLVVSDDAHVVGDLTFDTPVSVASGGTGANNATTARSNLSAAKSGANSDITSLASLSTPLSVAQGGTGANTLTNNNLIKGNGTGAVANLAPGTAGQVVTSNGTDWVSSDAPIVGTAKALLSNVNTTDGNNDSVSRGALVVGNSTPKWSKLTIGIAGQVLKSDGTDASWASPFKYFRDPNVTTTGAGPQFISSAEQLLCSFTSSEYTWTTATLGDIKFFHSITAAGRSGDTIFCPYKDGSTYYHFAHKDAATANWYRYSEDLSAETIMTMSGTNPGTFGAPRAYDFVNNIMYQLDATNSATVRKYTISGLTISNHGTPTLTLDAAPTAARFMFVSGNFLYIFDVVGGKEIIKKYNISTGVTVSSTTIAGDSTNGSPILTQDYVNNLFYIQFTASNSSQSAGAPMYPITLP